MQSILELLVIPEKNPVRPNVCATLGWLVIPASSFSYNMFGTISQNNLDGKICAFFKIGAVVLQEMYYLIKKAIYH